MAKLPKTYKSSNAKCFACNAEIPNTPCEVYTKYWCHNCLATGKARKSLDGPIPESTEKPEKSQGSLGLSEPKNQNMGQTVKPEAPPVAVSRPIGCPVCGGPARGRGYTHTPECPSYKPPVEDKDRRTCPLCGGFARGRGFSHKPGCKLLDLAKRII